MPGSVTPKGTGYPDYRRRFAGTLPVSVRSGSVELAGTVEHIRTIGTLRFAGTLRRLQQLGSVRYVQAGSLGRVERVGSVERIVYAARLGSLAAFPTVTRRPLGTPLLHTAVGSTYVGSWEDVTRFTKKSYLVRSSMAGSWFLVGGGIGTGLAGVTGTAYTRDLGAGSAHVFSLEEPYAFLRPIIRVGSVGSGKGTLQVALNLQP